MVCAPMLVSSMYSVFGSLAIACIGRMVHDLADSQALRHRPDGKDRLIQALQVLPLRARALMWALASSVNGPW